MADGTTTRGDRARAARSRVLRESSWAAVTAFLALLVGVWSVQAWLWTPGTPFDLGWDNTQISMQLKDIYDHGWYWHNPDIGFPFGQNGSWFPELNVLHVAIVKVLGWFTGDPFTPGAIFFLASWPLTGVTMYLLARSQGLSRPAGLVAGVLLANAPGHQERFGHLYLAAYWVVPVALWLVLEVARGRALLTPSSGGNRWWRGGRTWLTVSAVLIVGLSGVYYVGFTLILLVFATIFRRVTGRPMDLLRGLGVMFGLALVIGVPLVAAKLGTRGDLVTGRVPAQRSFAESELFAGKFMDLVLPWPEHIVPALQYVTFAYRATTSATVEVSALGVVGVAGLVGLTFAMLVSMFGPRRPGQDVGRWSGLLVVSFALYTVGGLGSFIAFFFTGQIRTWSRMSLYILVLCLMAVGLWLTRLQRRRGPAITAFVAGALVVVGSLDQVNPARAPDHAAITAEMTDLQSYTHDLQAVTGGSCGVFQLPVLPYPETLGPVDMQGYDQLKPYLADSTLKFSFGAMRGTAAADWMLAVDTEDARTLAEGLHAAGFCAIEVNHQGFSPERDPSSLFTDAFGPPAAETSNKVFSAWDIGDAASSDIEASRMRTLEPVLVTVNAYDVETVDGTVGQYLGPNAAITVANLGSGTVPVTVILTISGVGRADREVVVHAGDREVSRTKLAAGAPSTVRLAVDAPRGATSYRIDVSGPSDKERNGDRTVSAWVTDVRVSAPPRVRAVAQQSQVATGWVIP